MLNSCASGVSVVNIDNGFGAGYLASMINHMAVSYTHLDVYKRQVFNVFKDCDWRLYSALLGF